MAALGGNGGDAPGPAGSRPVDACPASASPPFMTASEQERYATHRKWILMLRGQCFTSLERVERHQKARQRELGHDDHPQTAGACVD
jgi:hypothetical protein